MYGKTQGLPIPDIPPHYIIHYCPGPNLPFHISSHLLHNCFLKMRVNKRPFPPSLKRFMVYAVKCVGLNWCKVCFKHDTKFPCHSLWLKMGIFQWCLPWLQGSNVCSILKGTEKPDGSSPWVLHKICESKVNAKPRITEKSTQYAWSAWSVRSLACSRHSAWSAFWGDRPSSHTNYLKNLSGCRT